MNGFWPSGLELGDTDSPKTILETAKKQWDTESNGMLTLVLRDAKSESGNKMIIVYAKYIPENKTTSLFSVIHRQNAPYPVTIQPEKDDLPDFLKKSYKRINPMANIAVLASAISEQTINNEWVAETPGEFRSKLHNAFNLGSVKYEVLGLITRSQSNENDTERGDNDNLSAESD